MAKTYTLDELKELVLTQINKINGINPVFTPEESDMAYDQAVRDVGFELPAIDDASIKDKYTWLIKRMQRWYVGQLEFRFSAMFDAGDLKSEQSWKHWQIMGEKMDLEFERAKDAVGTAIIFNPIDDVMGGSMVVDTGFVEDRVGQDLADR